MMDCEGSDGCVLTCNMFAPIQGRNSHVLKVHASIHEYKPGYLTSSTALKERVLVLTHGSISAIQTSVVQAPVHFSS